MVDRTDMLENREPILKIVATNVLHFRSDQEWAADDLASRVSLDRSDIIKIEAGLMDNLDIDHLGELADALEIEAWELVKERRVR